VEDTLEDWFRREILPHEAALMRFIARKSTNANDAQDIRHDIYIRILEAAERSRPSSPKAFLFSVTRNLLIDRARRDRIVAIDLLEDMDTLRVLIDDVTPVHASGCELADWRVAYMSPCASPAIEPTLTIAPPKFCIAPI